MKFLQKIPYYFSSLFIVIAKIKNPHSLLLVMFRKSAVLHFRNEISLLMTHPSDILVTKETMFDDAYKLRRLKKANTIIDVGGGIGEFSIMCSAKFPYASIYIFEPDRKSFNILRKNIEMNHCTNIFALPKAVGRKKRYTLYISQENDRSSTAAGGGEGMSVKGVRIQDITKKPIDLLKIDVEGAELDVLQSISADSYKRIKNVVLEFHNYLLENADSKAMQFLKQKGYHCEISYDRYDTSIGYIYAKKKIN